VYDVNISGVFEGQSHPGLPRAFSRSPWLPVVSQDGIGPESGRGCIGEVQIFKLWKGGSRRRRVLEMGDFLESCREACVRIV
jgi:hypothetical protein